MSESEEDRPPPDSKPLSAVPDRALQIAAIINVLAVVGCVVGVSLGDLLALAGPLMFVPAILAWIPPRRRRLLAGFAVLGADFFDVALPVWPFVALLLGPAVMLSALGAALMPSGR